MRKAIMVLALLAGCGSDAVYTWGELSEAVSEAYCTAQATCGYLSDGAVDLCTEHATWHLCDAKRSCDSELPEEARAATEACEDALAALDDSGCYWLGFWGVLPTGCNDVWKYEPKEDANG